MALGGGNGKHHNRHRLAHTPLGRLVNRFSNDVNSVDAFLAENLSGVLRTLLNLLGAVLTMVALNPIQARRLLGVSPKKILCIMCITTKVLCITWISPKEICVTPYDVLTLIR